MLLQVLSQLFSGPNYHYHGYTKCKRPLAQTQLRRTSHGLPLFSLPFLNMFSSQLQMFKNKSKYDPQEDNAYRKSCTDLSEITTQNSITLYIPLGKKTKKLVKNTIMACCFLCKGTSSHSPLFLRGDTKNFTIFKLQQCIEGAVVFFFLTANSICYKFICYKYMKHVTNMYMLQTYETCYMKYVTKHMLQTPYVTKDDVSIQYRNCMSVQHKDSN